MLRIHAQPDRLAILADAMTRRLPRIANHFLGHLPGWMFLVSGMAFISMAILTPTWLECRQLQWQHDIMRIQANRLAQQKQDYRQFYQALQSQNPILLERLAYHQMHLKPAGSQTLNSVETVNPQTVEGWLHTPLPRVGIDYPTLKVIPSKLVRLATGQTRLPLMAVGILSVIAALVWAGDRQETSSSRYRRTYADPF